MSNSDSPPDPPSSEQTRVDLGDDLLEKTASLVPLVRAEATPTELLENARILLGEGLTEEAKKLLRRILVVNPDHSAAKKKLDDIHELELKQIFGGEPSIGVRHSSGPPVSSQVAADYAIRSLDRDFNLGLYRPDGTELYASDQLFDSEDEMLKLATQLDDQYRGLDSAQRIDVGIAYLEMGFYQIALRQFEAAAQDDLVHLAAVSLQAHTLLLIGKAFEATLLLSALVRYGELLDSQKLEPFYLLGRAHEALHNPTEAKLWYEKAQSIEANYRDVQDRLKRR